MISRVDHLFNLESTPLFYLLLWEEPLRARAAFTLASHRWVPDDPSGDEAALWAS